jgi:hypothetical protein
MVKKWISIGILFFLAIGAVGAAQTAQIVSRWSILAGVLGGYQDEDNYVGGMGPLLEAEFALSNQVSLCLDAGGGYNVADGPLGGGGFDLKLRLLDKKRLDLALLGFGRGWYQASPAGTSYYVYGGGAALLSTLSLGYFQLTLGGGASYDFYGTSTDGAEEGSLGLLGIASMDFALSKASSMGLAFEYGGDRFFLGLYLNLAMRPWKAPAKEPVSRPTSKTATPKKK